MSQSQDPQPGAREPGGRVTRIDAAHPIRSKEPLELVGAPRELALIVAGDIQSHVGEQVRTQASQLASHLREKQQQIDHREAQLNARIALLEREVRTSRLWCAEREHVFVQREQERELEIFELQREIKGFAVTEVSATAELDGQRGDLRAREADLAAREHRLHLGQLQVAEEAESLRVAIERLRSERARHEQTVAATRQQADHREMQFVEQQRRLLANLKKREQLLEQREQQLDSQHRSHGIRSQQEVANALQEQRAAFEATSLLLEEQTRTLHDERALFEDRKREAEQNLAQMRDKLAARRSTLDQRHASLEQVKQHVFELHRETIEMRMVAEQLWQHAAKGRPVAELTQSLGMLRAKLADEFRVSRDDLSAKEQHLRELADKLGGRQQQLKQQRAELNQWLERRNTAIEEQAARLVAREVELDGQQREIREREAAWRAERCELQTQLRQVTRQLSNRSSAAA